MAAESCFFKVRQLLRPRRLLSQTSETCRWNTLTNGRREMETKGLCTGLMSLLRKRGLTCSIWHLPVQLQMSRNASLMSGCNAASCSPELLIPPPKKTLLSILPVKNPHPCPAKLRHPDAEVVAPAAVCGFCFCPFPRLLSHLEGSAGCLFRLVNWLTDSLAEWTTQRLANFVRKRQGKRKQLCCGPEKNNKSNLVPGVCSDSSYLPLNVPCIFYVWSPTRVCWFSYYEMKRLFSEHNKSPMDDLSKLTIQLLLDK